MEFMNDNMNMVRQDYRIYRIETCFKLFKGPVAKNFGVPITHTTRPLITTFQSCENFLSRSYFIQMYTSTTYTVYYRRLKPHGSSMLLELRVHATQGI
jgi:hypothetical protein